MSAKNFNIFHVVQTTFVMKALLELLFFAFARAFVILNFTCES